jgi:hypothetical protein
MAGAKAGLELARRAADRNEGTRYGKQLAELRAEIEKDREILSEVMASLGIRVNPDKQGSAWLAERIGRLKLNGRIVGYSPLSRLVEIEGLVVGVSGKLELWRSLRATMGSDTRLQGVDLTEMINRAEAQRKRLESIHEQAARDALSQGPH